MSTFYPPGRCQVYDPFIILFGLYVQFTAILAPAVAFRPGSLLRPASCCMG